MPIAKEVKELRKAMRHYANVVAKFGFGSAIEKSLKEKYDKKIPSFQNCVRFFLRLALDIKFASLLSWYEKHGKSEKDKKDLEELRRMQRELNADGFYEKLREFLQEKSKNTPAN